ncbi:MAG: hypothetical protein V5A87_07680 [Candidatus Bipolaricaulota bacterium]|nr:hypothetical protein [Candidatus Bipolaricaulota bacterium]
MKFQCPECGEIVYSQEEVNNCPGCNSRLEDRTPGAKEVDCPVSGGPVRQVNGIPDCNHFELTNAVGSRCTFGELPARCQSCGLPFYNPRVGVSAE